MNDWIRIFLSMVELEVRRIMHDRTELYFRAVQPLLWLLIFGHTISSLHVIQTGDISYIDYIMPGVLIQSTIMVSIFFGLVIIWERESGILKKLLATPSPRVAIVIGRSMAGGVRALFQAIIVIPVVMLLGVHILLNPLYLIAGLLVVFVSSGGFAGLAILIASFLKTREKFVGIGQVIVMPLFFASNALYPISAMPSILQAFANINPMTYVVIAVRGLMITGDLSQLPTAIFAIVLFDVIIFTLASRSFKKIVE